MSPFSSLLSTLLVLADPPSLGEVATLDPVPSSGTSPGGPVRDTPERAQGSVDRWIDRWAPVRNMVELGLFTGVYLPGRRHELFGPDIDLVDQGFQRYAAVAPEIGGRIGYYPIRWLGLEAEGGAMPTTVRTGSRATIWNARGSLVGQLGKWSVTPFALFGAGALGVASSRAAVGNDVDFSLHFGGGLKFFLSRFTELRLDLRDVVSHRQGLGNILRNHNFEALLGFSVTLGRKPKVEPDRDGDGRIDAEDRCPTEPAATADGCPPSDGDADGVLDDVDQCPAVAGDKPSGCPKLDTDGDSFLDDVDACPTEAGPAPDGCPARDTDGDGVLDANDACPNEAETNNGFEDVDGCPDEVPVEVKKFTGSIQGIEFDIGKATIAPASRPTLDLAVELLKQYPDIRLEISGHSDAQGARDFNVDLSRRRAEAVREYLVSKGIEPDRLTSRGAGPDEPIDTNETKQGRARNRRIEFQIRQGK